MRKARIAVLLPVRNGERDLPGFLESASRFADLILALDDGSTDSTREVLESSPLVARVLANPRRDTYAGWDDAANRRRLLQALDEFEAEWVLFLDADERIDAADGIALRDFARTEAVPGVAYGFLVVNMVGETGSYDADSGLWVYRMFAHERGAELPGRRLHFVPVPVSIPRRRWIRTTVRIQHIGGSDGERREIRFQKYREADPFLEYQAGYQRLLAGPLNVQPWKPRASMAPVLDLGEARFAEVASDLDREIERPIISAVVISQNDEATIGPSIGALVAQRLDQPFEVIVVTSGSDRTAEVVANEFPAVRVVKLPRPALPGEARNAGLWIAKGHYVTFPGSHVVVAPGSLRARVTAHDAGWDLVTGTTMNGNCTRPGWGAYFLDHSAVLPGRPSGELRAAPGHCSYARRDLDMVGGFPEDMRAGEDTVVNQLLFRLRRSAYRATDAAMVHASPCRTGPQLMRHFFGRGRAWGRILLERSASRQRLIHRRSRSLMSEPWRRMQTVSRNARSWAGPLRSEYLASRYLIAAGAVAYGLGTWYQVLRGASQPSRTARRRPPLAVGPMSGSVVVAHYGSPKAMGLGILGFGPRAMAAQRVIAHADRQPPGVAAPALYLLAVAATLTPGTSDAFSESLSDEEVAPFLALAEDAGARLILGFQPSRQSFLQTLQRFEQVLRLPNVGVGLQPAWHHVEGEPGAVDPPSWPTEGLEQALDWLSDVVPTSPKTIVLIHSTPEVGWPEEWTAASRPGLDVIGLADLTGTLDEKRTWLDQLAARAPAVGVQFRLRGDREIVEPVEALRLWPALRIVVYR